MVLGSKFYLRTKLSEPEDINRECFPHSVSNKQKQIKLDVLLTL